jgi:hypothetical protein
MKGTSMHSSDFTKAWNVSTMLVGAILLACQAVDSNGDRVPTGSSEAAIPAEPVTLAMDAFDVGPGEETFQCQSYANPFRRDVDIVTSESTMTPHSHHLLAFHQSGLANGPAAPCQGLEFHPFIHSAQVPHLVITYPPSVGRFLPGDDGVKILAHYLNTMTETIHANVKLALTVTDTLTTIFGPS